MTSATHSHRGPGSAGSRPAGSAPTADLRFEHRRAGTSAIRVCNPGWAARAVAAFLLVSGLAMAVGGAWLAALGGSPYYVTAGIGLSLAGGWMWAGRSLAVWLVFAVVLASAVWTAWESGTDYWRWVPRMDLMVVAGLLTALVWPRLDAHRSRKLAWGVAAAFGGLFVLAFALALAPHGVTRTGYTPERLGSNLDPSAIAPSALAGLPLQPAVLPDAADWPAYGRSYAAQRYSPLRQITPENVGQLERAWVFHTGDLPDERWGAETTPLKVGNRMYLCTARNQIIALDARNGQELWRHDPQVADQDIPYTAACRGVSYYVVPQERMADASGGAEAPAPARGGAAHAARPAAAALAQRSTRRQPPVGRPLPAVDITVGQGQSHRTEGQRSALVLTAGTLPQTPGLQHAVLRVAQAATAAPLTTAVAAAQPLGACRERIIEGTLDGRLIAVDAATGHRCAGFGVNGEVDIKIGMGKTPHGFVAITSPPVIVQGVIVTGQQVLDNQRRMAPSGVIQGFDAVTGELRWAWDMARPDRTGRPPEGETYTRGTPNMWTIAAGDESLGLVYLPMGNAAADYVSASRRPAENRFASALVALDVNTGKPVWHFQTVRKDVWDYDLGSQPTLVDHRGADGSTVPAIILPSKQGEIYVLDRRTGEPLHDVIERPAPQGGVEPRERAPMQPYSGFHTLARPPLTERDMWGLTPFDQLACRIQFRQANYEGAYTPPSADKPFIQYPGYNGGSDWGSVAVDPTRGVIIANYNDMPNYNQLVPRAEADAKGWVPRDEQTARKGSTAEGAGDPMEGTPYAIDVNAGWRLKATGLLCKEPPYGGIRAIDMATGQTLWDRPLGTGRRNGPWGIASHLPVNVGTPNNGGPVVTAGGLVFVAAATDDLIRAIDLRTGETVWSDALPAGGQATPMVYAQDGREFLVIMAGGHHFMETPRGDAVIAYALPQGG